MGELSTLNPRIRTITIGVRKLYTITVYPLSFGDELKFLDKISSYLTRFVTIPEQDRSDAVLATFIAEFIKEAFPEIVSLVIDMDEWNTLSEGKELLSCLDNYQLIDFAQLIYEMNFGEQFQKKAKETVESFSKMMTGTAPMQPLN